MLSMVCLGISEKIKNSGVELIDTSFILPKSSKDTTVESAGVTEKGTLKSNTLSISLYGSV